MYLVLFNVIAGKNDYKCFNDIQEARLYIVYLRSTLNIKGRIIIYREEEVIYD